MWFEKQNVGASGTQFQVEGNEKELFWLLHVDSCRLLNAIFNDKRPV
jgi:hypothetical protein